MPVAASPLRFSSGALRQMSNTDINDYVSERIGESFASTESTGSLNTSSGTSIGILSDNYTVINANGVVTGSGKVTGESILYQNTTLVTPATPTRPLKYSDVVGGLQQMSDGDIDTYISAVVAKYIADGGVGSYALGLTAPSDGDTWTSRATITNRRALQDGTYTGNPTVGYLWQKTASSSVTTKRPVHYDTSVKEMTDVQIQTLTDRVRNEIVNNSIGTYKLATSAPTTGGTWRQCGSGIDDVVTSTYTNVFTGNYTSLYTQQYTSQYTTVWTSTFAAGYTQGYTTAYTQQFTGEYNAVYGAKSWSPSSPPTAFFTSTYTGLTYTSEFNAVYTLANEYTTVAVYGGAEYTSVYTAPSYTSVYTLVYTTTNDLIFTNAYTTESLTSFVATYTTVDIAYYTTEWTASWTSGGWTVTWTVSASTYGSSWTSSWSREIYYSGIRNYAQYYISPRYHIYAISYTGPITAWTFKYTRNTFYYYSTQEYTGSTTFQQPVTTVLEYTRQSSGTVYGGYTLTPTDGWTSSPLYFTDQVIFNVWPEDPALRYTGFAATAYGNYLSFGGYFTKSVDLLYTSSAGVYTKVIAPQIRVSTFTSIDNTGPMYTRSVLLFYTDITEKVFTAPAVYTSQTVSSFLAPLNFNTGTLFEGGGTRYVVQNLNYGGPPSFTSSFTNNYIVGGIYSGGEYSAPPGTLPTVYYTNAIVAYAPSFTPGLPTDLNSFMGVYTRNFAIAGPGIYFGAEYARAFTRTAPPGSNPTDFIGTTFYGGVTHTIQNTVGNVAWFSTPLYFTGQHYALSGEVVTWTRSWSRNVGWTSPAGTYTLNIDAYYTRGVSYTGTLIVSYSVLYTTGVSGPGYWAGFYIDTPPVTWTGTGLLGYYATAWLAPITTYTGNYTGALHNFVVYAGSFAAYIGFQYPNYSGAGSGYVSYYSTNIDLAYYTRGHQYTGAESFANMVQYNTGVYGGRTPVAYTREYNRYYLPTIWYYTRGGDVYANIFVGWTATYYTRGFMYTRSYTGTAVYNKPDVVYHLGFMSTPMWTRDDSLPQTYTARGAYGLMYTGPGYTGVGGYLPTYAATRSWTGGGQTYIKNYSSPAINYLNVVNYGLSYSSFWSRTYVSYTSGDTSVYQGSYITYYRGYARYWIGSYTRGTGVAPAYANILPANYNAFYTGPEYTGLTFASAYTSGTGTVTYTSGPYTPTLVYSMEYTGTYTSEYSGPEYTNEFASSFQTTYTGGYTGEPVYTSALEYTSPLYTAQYIGAWSIIWTAGPFTQQFTKLYTSVSDVAYAGIYSNVYTQQYTHTTPVVWTSIYANVYTLAVTENYTVRVIDNTYTRTNATYYLWVRTA